MKTSLTLYAVSFCCAMLLALSAAANTKPNVLLIISDDQGFGDFGFNGNRLVQTPQLDRLAGESAVYRNFSVAAACSPTRAAVFTGRDHLLTGVWGVPPRANLRPDEARIPAFFMAVGYRTLHVGKLDCAKMGKGNPTDFGWEDYLGGGGYEHRDPMMWKPRNSARGQGWTVDLWTDYTLQFIREHGDQPWFISLAYIIPHMPWICDEKYSAPFLAQGCPSSLAACYGSIAHLDECIGRLLDGLKATRQDQRTIVVFISDNGPTSPEVKKLKDEEALVKDADWQKRNVAKLRGHKALVWENGDRVPLLVRWPGHIAPGARRQFGCAEDILPTVLDLAGLGTSNNIPDFTKSGMLPAHLPFSGISLRASLENAAQVIERPEVFRMAISGPGSPRDNIADVRQRKYEDHHLTLRGPRFKFHALPGGKRALFDLDADPGEVTDVQAKFPDIAARMERDCRARWELILASGRSFVLPPEGGKTKAKKGEEL